MRQKLMEGKTQQAAAASAAMSERTASRWQRGALPSVRKKNRHRWRTRPDPFADVWENDVEPLLRSDPEGELSATTILEWLDERHPGRFSSSQLRTLQRRFRRRRMPKEGMLVQVAGSHHHWLEERGPKLVVLLAVDDATSAVAQAIFRTTEDTRGFVCFGGSEQEREDIIVARGYRSSGFRSGGRSRSSSFRSGRAGALRAGSSNQSQKGQVKHGKVVQYAIKAKNGQTKYIGSTNNPTPRAAQHQKSGKMPSGDKLQVQSKPISRGTAERLERGRLKGHRREHGRNPQHNKTNDGQYHPRLF